MIRPSARSGRRRQRGGTKSFPFPPDNRFRYEPKTDRMPKKISPFRSLLLCAALSLTGQAPAQPGPTPGLTFEQPGSAERFTAVNGSVATRDGALEYTFRKGSSLSSPPLAGSRHLLYNPTLEKRNTVLLLMENRSSSPTGTAPMTKRNPRFSKSNRIRRKKPATSTCRTTRTPKAA